MHGVKTTQKDAVRDFSAILGRRGVVDYTLGGDFGGGVFHKNGSTWELTGLIVGVVGFSGQPNPEENAVFGNETLVADLSFYRPQIMAIVPEPHPVVLAASGLGGLVLWRLLRRRLTTFVSCPRSLLPTVFPPERHLSP
jgi:hypothetical protein